MGFDTKARDEYRDNLFAKAFSFALQKSDNPTIAIVDFMAFVKVLPDEIKLRHEMIEYFCNKVKRIMKPESIRVCIVLVDGKKIPVKHMVVHTTRYANINVYKYEKGKCYLPKKALDLVPTEWNRFAGNYKLLRRELYPILFNAFMNCDIFTPRPGQMLVLSGFPGRSRYETVYRTNAWDLPTNAHNQQLVVQMWNVERELPITPEMEEADPDLYNRVYILENVVPCPDFPQGALIQREWVEAKNDISEADIRMFYFDYWFQNETIIFHLNDGDVLTIGSLYAFERFTCMNDQGEYFFRNKHIACMPYKKKAKQEPGAAAAIEAQRPPFEYIDFNVLYQEMREHYALKNVQNAVATMAFLAILSGSDFFQDFMKGIGAIKGVWEVFFSNVEALTHMVQISEGVIGDCRTKRTIVVDEDLFIQFIYWCYLQKYETSAIKMLTPKGRGKKEKLSKITYDQLKERTKVSAKGIPVEDAEYHLPDRNKIRLWCRQIEWNLQYWKNGPLGFYPDPFETWGGVPYYPYTIDPETKKYKMIDVVAARPKPVDAVFARHLHRNLHLRVRKKKAKDVEELARGETILIK